MAKEWAKAFYNSKAWQQCRDSYISERIAIDGGICEVCGSSQGSIVHHKKILTQSNISNPDVTLKHSNLQYVCKDCHDKFEGHGVGSEKTKLLFAFDKDGQPVSLREIDNPPSNQNHFFHRKTDGRDWFNIRFIMKGVWYA